MNCPPDSHGLQHDGSASGRPAPAAGLIERGFAAIGNAVAPLFFWQSVSRTIQQLSALNDAELQRRGLAREEIVPWVYRSACAEQARKMK